MNLHFRLHCLERELSNFSILKYRDFQGYIVTGQHSGTHWLKYLMSCAIAHKYNLPVPQYTSNDKSNDFIGHPKHKRIYPQCPRIASTHQIPHALYDSRILRKLIYIPPTVLMVRDIRPALVSNFEKWTKKYNVSFSTYLRGDISEKKYIADIWWFIRFFNRWGRIHKRFPENTLVIHYEDLLTDTQSLLQRIFNHINIDISEADLIFAVKESSREKMAAKAADESKPGQGQFVRQDKREPLEWFSQTDINFFEKTIRENLRYDFGYNFFNNKIEQ